MDLPLIKLKTISEGWVVVNEHGEIMDFTFSGYRRDAQRKWTELWDRPNNWKAHYKKGCRCKKANRIIETTL